MFSKYKCLRKFVATSSLYVNCRIQDFEPGDAGIYKCYVSHRYPVSTPNGMAAGTFAPAFEVVIATGSIWIKEIKPDSARLPIGTPEVRNKKY